MVEMDVTYAGDLHCSATHAPSGNTIATDAPKDNHGRGEAFSPTDLVAAALGACMLTIVGLYARRHQLDIAGATAHVAKDMVAAPARRIGTITVQLKLPASVPPEHRQALENAARACPVAQSLHPGVQKLVEFVYA